MREMEYGRGKDSRRVKGGGRRVREVRGEGGEWSRRRQRERERSTRR
tara:strand:- start:2157 stop:2297 length:141 start_codon:yes stop_codon:yes gene_type:complete